MKIKVNYSVLLEKLNIYKLLFSLMVCFQLYLFCYDPGSIKFTRQFFGTIFIALIVNASFFSIFFFFNRKKEYYKYGFFSLLCSNAAIYLFVNNPPLFDYFSKLMSSVFLESIVKIRFVQVSVNDGGLFWIVMLCFYISLFLIIYGNWIVKNKKMVDGFWKIERQLFYTGLGIYGVLILLIFIFTHFTFVGSNYMYMEGLLKYTDKIVDMYDRKNQYDNFQLKDLKYFKSIDDAYSYYANPVYKNRVYIGKNEDKIEYYNRFLNNLIEIKKNGIVDKEKLKYEKINNFSDWVQISYNLSFKGSSATEKKSWELKLIPILRGTGDLEEILRMSTFYIKESNEKGYYVYYVMDRTFKDFKMNYIFNSFFILFHIVFLLLFAYLLKIHQRKNLIARYKEVK